jgi:glycerophosphoryl diester phosphodiesterase
MNSKIKNFVVYSTILTLSFPRMKLMLDYEIDYEDFTVVAHRGFSSLEIENSKAAIDLCYNYEYIDGLEIDVSMTKDNELVVLHTGQSGHNYNLKKSICEYTLDELKAKTFKIKKISTLKNILFLFNIDSMNKTISKRSTKLLKKEEPIITFDELISEYDGKKLLLIDVKFNNQSNIMIEKLLNALSNIDCNNIIIQSDNYENLSKMKTIKPNLSYQLVISDRSQMKYINTDFIYFAIRDDLIDYNTLNNLINDGKKIAVWTINSEYKLNTIIGKAGAYADDLTYITDYPDCISTLLDAHVNVKKH